MSARTLPAPARVVTRRRRRVARAQRRRHQGQTMIEFAFVFVVLLFGIMGSLSAAIWAMENMAAVSAAENATRVVAAAKGVNGANADTAVAANATAALAPIVSQLKQSMVGTPVSAGAWGSCPTQAQLKTYGSASVHVCARVAGTQIQVLISGCGAAFTGKFGFGGCGAGVPIYQYAAIQQLTFTQ